MSRTIVLPDGCVHFPTGAVVGFCAEDLIVEVSYWHVEVPPVVEVVGGCDGVIRSCRRAAPGIEILLKGLGAFNGGLVDLLVLVGVVVMPVARNAPLIRRVAGIKRTEFGDVILHERIGQPPIDRYGVIAASGADVVTN